MASGDLPPSASSVTQIRRSRRSTGMRASAAAHPLHSELPQPVHCTGLGSVMSCLGSLGEACWKPDGWTVFASAMTQRRAALGLIKTFPAPAALGSSFQPRKHWNPLATMQQDLRRKRRLTDGDFPDHAFPEFPRISLNSRFSIECSETLDACLNSFTHLPGLPEHPWIAHDVTDDAPRCSIHRSLAAVRRRRAPIRHAFTAATLLRLWQHPRTPHTHQCTPAIPLITEIAPRIRRRRPLIPDSGTSEHEIPEDALYNE